MTCHCQDARPRRVRVNGSREDAEAIRLVLWQFARDDLALIVRDRRWWWPSVGGYCAEHDRGGLHCNLAYYRGGSGQDSAHAELCRGMLRNPFDVPGPVGFETALRRNRKSFTVWQARRVVIARDQRVALRRLCPAACAAADRTLDKAAAILPRHEAAFWLRDCRGQPGRRPVQPGGFEDMKAKHAVPWRLASELHRALPFVTWAQWRNALRRRLSV